MLGSLPHRRRDLLQVLHLLEKIKRQNAGEEDLPPIAIAPLPTSESLEKPKKAKPSAQEELTEDGFLDLEGADEDAEGFLLDENVALEDEADEVEEEYEDDEVDEDEDDDDYDEDAPADAIDAYLGGQPCLTILESRARQRHCKKCMGLCSSALGSQSI